jgi:hypothetical protein
MSRPRFRPGIDLPAEQIEANRRYWETEESVNGIAEAMGVSKGRLYDLLLPFDADLPLPGVRIALGYPHRTARDRGDRGMRPVRVRGALDDLPPAGEGADGPRGPSRTRRPGRLLHWTPGGYGDPLQRTVVGVALLGRGRRARPRRLAPKVL